MASLLAFSGVWHEGVTVAVVPPPPIQEDKKEKIKSISLEHWRPGLDEMASDEGMAPDARLASSPGRRCVMLGSSPRWPVVVAAMFRPAKLNR
jgi:hypothetical protein